MNSQKGTILVCPLNWGLGHATRDIPVIKRLMARGFRVIVASEANILHLLQQEIPYLETDYFPGAKITYAPGNNQVWALLRQLPSALAWLNREKKITRHLVNKYKPIAIISDNRYGVRHSKVKSILITHQLMLKMPAGWSALERPFHWLVKHLVSKFDHCWIPDLPQPHSLAGDLTHKYPLPKNAKLVGPLSRFMDPIQPNKLSDQVIIKQAELLVLLSGPEPQRTILEEILQKKVADEKIKTIMVTGKPGTNPEPSQNQFLQKHSHIESEQIQSLIINTPSVLCRSGYSTLMDLWFLNREAILIPTPGQTEQEYLSQYHRHKGYCTRSQTELARISLRSLLSRPVTENTNGLLPSKNLLDAAIDSLFASWP